jgi:hypothetical protein
LLPRSRFEIRSQLSAVLATVAPATAAPAQPTVTVTRRPVRCPLELLVWHAASPPSLACCVTLAHAGVILQARLPPPAASASPSTLLPPVELLVEEAPPPPAAAAAAAASAYSSPSPATPWQDAAPLPARKLDAGAQQPPRSALPLVLRPHRSTGTPSSAPVAPHVTAAYATPMRRYSGEGEKLEEDAEEGSGRMAAEDGSGRMGSSKSWRVY